MTTARDSREERRKSVRVTPKGSVVLLVEGAPPQRGRITNLSKGGVLVAVSAPTLALDDVVALELRVDRARDGWLRLSGRVSRIDTECIAIEFHDSPAELAVLLRSLSDDANVRDRRLSIVLVDATAARREALSEAFRAAGCLVIDVATPLGAIAELGGASFEPDLIAIADSTGEVSDELRRFVSDRHPAAKLVRIGDDVTEPTGLVHWLSSANPDDDLVARIRRLLGSQR